MREWLNHILSDFYHKYLDDVVGIGSGIITSYIALDVHIPYNGVLSAIVKGLGIFFGGFLGWIGKECAVWVWIKLFGKSNQSR